MLAWANRSGIFCFLDNQNYNILPQQYECLLAAGVRDFIASNLLEDLNEFISRETDWIFGHLAYDLKNTMLQLQGTRKDPIGFPPFYFFRPRHLLQIKGDELIIKSADPDLVFEEILGARLVSTFNSFVHLQQRLSREAYLKKIRLLQEHIKRGDCYEINFCQEFYAEQALIEPVSTYLELTKHSPNPFSALYRLHDRYLICASPERFLMKTGDKLISQPMKGTIRRNLQDPEQDYLVKETLKESTKDRSENVMVVDLVRNDLSRICSEGSVQVEAMFQVFTYPHVHQMISTISGHMRPGVLFSEIVEATFPMGSMTGAPKVRVMELIEAYEVSSRGIFSGSVGYMDPSGDFDFNVVIRSIMYQSASKYLSYQVGSGITCYSDPEKEWEECLLKGEAIKEILERKVAGNE